MPDALGVVFARGAGTGQQGFKKAVVNKAVRQHIGHDLGGSRAQ